MYCFIVIFQNSRKKNFSILTDIQSYFSNQYITTGSEKVYFTIVSFANNIKDVFLDKLGYNNKREYIINEINELIIYLFQKENLKNAFTETNYGYILPKPKFIEQKIDKRNYDEELSLLDWSTMKELRENEDCKENNQCISKICRHNKCTRPTPNDKLDFLSKLEWDQL